MKKVITCFLLLLCIGLGALLYVTEKDVDRTAPVIHFPDGEFLYREGEDTSVLLAGVRALDAVDGDVSDTLVVESVIPMENGTKATVIYYAKDKSNNVAKTSRTVDYQPEQGNLWEMGMEGPETGTTEPVRLEEASEEIQGETGQEPEESIQGTVQRSEESIQGETGQGSEESIQGQTGQGSEEPSEPETQANGNPGIRLKADKATVRQAEGYDLLSFVDGVWDDEDDYYYLYRQIYIEGKDQISSPGVYELYYYVTDRQGNQSNREKLTLTVE